jgi:predicted methyltransferase family protein/methyltransferase family protein/protein-lysine methyltransferase-like protein
MQYDSRVMSAYNQVPYINSPFAQTHPSRLFVMGRLAGLDPPAVETCRVLEIGASQGENLIGMAIVLPSAEFVGIDLAEVPVTRGQKTIANLGLGNVRLRQMNVLEIDEGFGEFDYIIAHGLYSWTPGVVRDKLLAVARSHLSAQGVAFISYNTYPGGYVRKMLREMMLFHIGDEADPERKLKRARELLRMMAIGRPQANAHEAAVAARAAELLERTDSALYHDDLSDSYEPVYFHEFAAHAARHDLKTIGEASLVDPDARNLAPEAVVRIREMAAGDVIAEAQYFDFARTRLFRETLLCHAGNTLREGNAHGCYAATSAQETEDGVFVSSSSIRMKTTHPGLVEYIRRLIGLWPGSELVAPGDADLGLQLFRMGMIDVHGFAGVARRAGEMPCAGRFARYQAARGDSHMTTLWHCTMGLGNEEARKLVCLLDGSSDRAQLAREMGCSREVLDGGLEVLAKEGMLTQ